MHIEHVRSKIFSISKLYEERLKEFKRERRIILYGAYLEKHREGIALLEYLRGGLRKRGFQHVYLVKDIDDQTLGLSNTSGLAESVKNLLRSVQSLRIADIPVFVLSAALTRYIAGVVVELAIYAALLEHGEDVPPPNYALVLISARVKSKLTSLIRGIIERYKIPNKLYTGRRTALDAIIAHIENIIYQEVQTLP